MYFVITIADVQKVFERSWLFLVYCNCQQRHVSNQGSATHASYLLDNEMQIRLFQIQIHTSFTITDFI